MSVSQPTVNTPPAPVGDLPDQSPHYTNAISELGEDRNVFAQEDIYAANGMKLLAKGARINRSQSERLNLHKLRAPLDLLLSVEGSVDAVMLAADANRMFADDPAMARMTERSGDPQGFRQGLGALSLSPPLRFRMTVMREKRTDLYQHTLRVASITHAMAVRLSLSERDKHDLLLAGLTHDLGEMHTDPVLLASSHRILTKERRFIHVHPITSFVILQDMPGIPAATLQAVLHHHERLDGSGYPYGFHNAQIHPLAKVLCVAEVMEGVVRRADLHRLDVLLRLNQRRFDPAVVDALRGLLRADMSDGQATPGARDVSLQLTHVMAVLAAWPALCDALDVQSPKAPGLQFITKRMMMLRSLVLQSGINPEDADVLLKLAREDNQVLCELQATLDELGWLMIDIVNETERRAVGLDAQSQGIVSELVSLLRAG